MEKENLSVNEPELVRPQVVSRSVLFYAATRLFIVNADEPQIEALNMVKVSRQRSRTAFLNSCKEKARARA